MDASVEAIARAVLYEGYLLYPYRLSAMKNRHRWSFGILYPSNYCQEQNGTERSEMQTECVLQGDSNTTIAGAVRFLQHSGDETLEREVELPSTAIGHLCTAPREVIFSFPPIQGTVRMTAQSLGQGLYKIRVTVANDAVAPGQTREDALPFALISNQKLLRLNGGKFFSSIEPPECLQGTSPCENIGAWPVLAGDSTARNTVLSAPIILQDFPQTAPESPGDFFDGTEIDEMLSLRILTLADSEKEEMKQLDGHTRNLLQRTEASYPDKLLDLHGVFRDSPANGEVKAGAFNGGMGARLQVEPPAGPTPAGSPNPTMNSSSSSITNQQTSLRAGDRVRLRPQARADIFDIALAGKTATITSIEHDFEDRIYVCVVLDDDPGRDLGMEGKPGHRFFFGLEEVELL